MFAYMSFYALLEKKYKTSSALFSLAVSIKMNVLLFAPAFALILHEQIGLIASIKNALIFLSIQVCHLCFMDVKTELFGQEY